MITENENPVKKGEIYIYDFGKNKGSIQNGIRPVLVIQADEFNSHSPTTIIAAITSAIKKEYLPSHIYLGDDFGLRLPSMVLLEQSKTVNQCDLIKYIGIVDNERVIKKINRGIKKTFGFWNYLPKKNSEVRCLCGRCLRYVREDHNLIIRRLNPFQDEKGKCDRCLNYGYDYIVYRRKFNNGSK